MQIKLIFEEFEYKSMHPPIKSDKYNLRIDKEQYANNIVLYGDNLGLELWIEEGEEYKLKIINGLLKLLEIDCELVM